jgi:hypothetical protein
MHNTYACITCALKRYCKAIYCIRRKTMQKKWCCDWLCHLEGPPADSCLFIHTYDYMDVCPVSVAFKQCLACIQTRSSAYLYSKVCCHVRFLTRNPYLRIMHVYNRFTEYIHTYTHTYTHTYIHMISAMRFVRRDHMLSGQGVSGGTRSNVCLAWANAVLECEWFAMCMHLPLSSCVCVCASACGSTSYKTSLLC